MLKVQLHTHVKGDPIDRIPHTAKDLIKEAARLNYDVLAITCHRKRIFTKSLERFAKKHNILLLPGIEFEINGKHILGINVDKNITKVTSFEKLAAYRKSHPNCLIIAPHPFFPTKECLQKDLINNIQLFDAIENSFFYTKSKNYNDQALALAKRWRKPVISTADCHILKHLDIAFTEVDARKTASSVVKAIKAGKLKNSHQPSSYFKLGKIFTSMLLQYFK